MLNAQLEAGQAAHDAEKRLRHELTQTLSERRSEAERRQHDAYALAGARRRGGRVHCSPRAARPGTATPRGSATPGGADPEGGMTPRGW